MRLPDKLRALFRSRKSRESATTDKIIARLRDLTAEGRMTPERGLELIRRAEALRP